MPKELYDRRIQHPVITDGSDQYRSCSFRLGILRGSEWQNISYDLREVSRFSEMPILDTDRVYRPGGCTITGADDFCKACKAGNESIS